MESAPIILPRITIQHDFQSVITDVREGTVPSEEFWISCYKLNEPSVHGKVFAELDEIDRNKVNLDSRGGVVVIYGDSPHYNISCPQLGITPTKIRVPSRSFSGSSSGLQRITAFDISPDGTQFATGGHDGTVLLQPTNLPRYENKSKPHVSTITSLRFFPSSRVLLTAGADFSLSILPAKLEASESLISPARTLRGHTRSVTDTAIIAKGRNVLSSAKDGTLRLWDVSAGNSIRTIGSNHWTPIYSISLGIKGTATFGTPNPDGEPPSPPTPIEPNQNEVETGDKVVFCALSDGSLEAFDLGTKLSVHKNKVGVRALTTVSYSPEHSLVATGSINGVVTVFDTRSLAAPVTSFVRGDSSIEDIVFTSSGVEDAGVGVVIGTEDGLSYVASVRPEGPAVLSELVGTDCDAIRVVRVSSDGAIWSAGDDGIIRRY